MPPAGRRAPTTAQASRRRRILVAAGQLARAGGYAAVGMREVANRSDVALATVYAYFPSKDHLLTAVMADALARSAAVPESAPRGASAVREMLSRATQQLLANPDLTAAMLQAWVMAEPDDPSLAVIARTSKESFADALHGGPGARVSAGEADALRVINRVWFSELLLWSRGRVDADEVMATVDAVVTTLLEKNQAST